MSAIAHFLNCARRGACRGASSGDMAANRLATVTLQNLTHYAALDSSAREGLAQIVQAATSGGYETAADVLERVAENSLQK
jgi:hypothetical protein